MDSDQGKLFVGGISWETTEEKLNEYFNQFGEVSQTAVMKDKITGRPRGFGFVLFSDPSVLDLVLQEKHTIDGRMVEVKRALSREEQQSSGRSGVSNTGRTSGAVRTKKIFVGGLPSTLTEDEFREYFETYGSVTDAVIMFDQNTQRPRGFGFISFDAEEAVDRVLHKTYHDLSGKKVEVKRALPKDANIGGGNRNMGGSYPSYDGQMDTNRYMQPPGSAAGFQSYGSSGYGAAGYGYGPASTGMGYGSYGGLAGAAYGNPNVPSSGYPQSGARGQWGSQAPSGYGMGYGSAPSGQSPGAVAGYGGTQGYGYGGYMSAANGGYGASGARGAEMHGNNGGGAYGDVNGNAAWRSQQ